MEKCTWRVSTFFMGYKTSCGYQINRVHGKPVKEQINNLKFCPICNKEIKISKTVKISICNDDEHL